MIIKPPLAKKLTRKITIHGHILKDDYFWLRDKDNKEVIKYLKAENKYAKNIMTHNKRLKDSLFKEMKTRIKEDDTSAPIKIDHYYYYSRTKKNKQYPIFCRKKGNLLAKEEIILDQNNLAKGHKYHAIGVFEISEDHSKLAYSVDIKGSERYTIFIKDLTTGKILKDKIPDTEYSLAWANDNSFFFYTKVDESMRPYKVYKHSLGTSYKNDTLIYHEKDERFFVYLSKTRSKKYIFIGLRSKESSEIHYINADLSDSKLRIINPREEKHLYVVDHHENNFIILSNYQAKNFRLMKAPIKNPSKKYWKEILPHRTSILIENFSAFKNYLVVYEMTEGLTRIRIKNFNTNEENYIDFDEVIYAIEEDKNPKYDINRVRFSYSSLITPESIIEYDMDKRKKHVIKIQEILGGYDSSKYVVERTYATAKDGENIPISLAYKKGIKKEGKNPLWLYGYGAYGYVIKPSFSSNIISLLDRDFIYAIAHIRGGEDKGRAWYESGKYLKKINTFTDFIACADHLVSQKYTSKEKLVIHGASAGGLLIGAVLNIRPDLFSIAIGEVPFVDVVNTMLDPKLPLTITEYEEWGNPNNKKYFKYMLSYSPYDNIKPQHYPNMLFTAGLNDPRVSYWEPAKLIAKLRTIKKDDNLLLLKTNMGTGHRGSSGRYDYLKEIVFNYAFALDLLHIKS